MQPSKTLAQKLQIKANYRIRIINAPENDVRILGEMPETVHNLQNDEENLDWVMLFVSNRKELEQNFHASFAALKPDGLLWICYPKISSGVGSDITRDKGWDPVFAAGLKPVGQIAIDATWSALRFRPKA